MIAVATLLVAVVGATFAYFTATNQQTDDKAAKVDVSTKEVGGTTFTLNGSEVANKLDYPGGIAIIKAVANAKKDSGDDENSYDFTYDLQITGNVGNMTGVKWALYESTVDSNVTNTDLSSCKLKNDTTSEVGKTLFYYTTSESEDKDGLNPCSAEGLGLDDKLTEDPIAYGTITESQVAADEQSNMNKLSGLTIKNVNDNLVGSSKYYYLVIEYPNKGEQSGEMSQTGSISLTLKENSVKAEIAAGA